MSIHGCCFDEGQSGNCGCDCRCFIGGKCDIPGEIADIFKEELLQGHGDQLLIGIIKAQTVKNEEPHLEKELARIMFDEFGYII